MDQEAITKTETTFEEIYVDDVNHQSLPMDDDGDDDERRRSGGGGRACGRSCR